MSHRLKWPEWQNKTQRKGASWRDLPKKLYPDFGRGFLLFTSFAFSGSGFDQAMYEFSLLVGSWAYNGRNTVKQR